MVLGIAEDLTSKAVLDSELTELPLSGIYANSGVHPSVNVDNLLAFLPSTEITVEAWSGAKAYGVFSTTRKRNDLVFKNGKLYQSIKTPNANQDPEADSSPFWIVTNLNSLRIKTFLYSVKDNVYSKLNLTKRLVDNQFIYEGETYRRTATLQGNYSAWVFEPKGSDYVSIRINQIAFTKAGTTPVNLYVINQGRLVETLQLTPSNGELEFKDLNYTFKGKGRFILAIDSTEVITSSGYNDPLRYEGFVCYPTTGIGTSPESATYNQYGTQGNGMGFNVTAVLDASVYIDSNLNEFAEFVRATFEYMAFQTFLSNANNRSNRQQLIQMTEEVLKFEVMSSQGNSSFTRLEDQRKKAVKQLRKTFDTQLESDTEGYLEVETSSF